MLKELAAIAPVPAVYGNTDRPEIRARSPGARIQHDGVRIVLSHGDQVGSPTPAKLNAAYPDAEMLVFGHTHRPLLTIVAEGSAS